MENTVPEMINSLEGFNSRLGQAEEIINGLEKRLFEIIDSEEQKGKRKNQSEERLRGFQNFIR